MSLSAQKLLILFCLIWISSVLAFAPVIPTYPLNSTRYPPFWQAIPRAHAIGSALFWSSIYGLHFIYKRIGFNSWCYDVRTHLRASFMYEHRGTMYHISRIWMNFALLDWLGVRRYNLSSGFAACYFDGLLFDRSWHVLRAYFFGT